MLKFIKRAVKLFLGAWIVISFIDYNFARTMYGGMVLSDYNILVVAYKLLDRILQGFIF
jgi:hypothetical protein